MSSEHGPGIPQESTVEKIERFKTDFENWLTENPDIASELKEELLEMAGVEENELVNEDMGFNMGLLKISVSELPSFGTASGTKGNKPFSGEVVEFLRSKGIEFTVALSENTEPIVSSIAINIQKEDANKIEEMIAAEQGSLRSDNSKIDGWSVFESE